MAAELSSSSAAKKANESTAAAKKDVDQDTKGGADWLPFHKVWCKMCKMTWHWSDREKMLCSVCAHMDANLSGSTLVEKRNTFFNLSIDKALLHDKKVPNEWLLQYIRTRTVSLFEHFSKLKENELILLSGKSGRMQILDMCRLAETPRALGAAIGNRFLRGELVGPAFLELRKKFTDAEWESDSWEWAHALAPRVIDIWNIVPNPSGAKEGDVPFTADSHAYSVTQCYYQNLGEYSKEPPTTFTALFDHWRATVRRQDLMV